MKNILTYISGAASNINDLDALIKGEYAVCIELCGSRGAAIEKVIEYVRAGDQAGTLDLLDKYSAWIRSWIGLGVRVIVPTLGTVIRVSGNVAYCG